jgi:hypothetical protein
MDSGSEKEKDVASEPIPGPSPAGPEYIFEYDRNRPRSYTLIVGRFMAELVRTPVNWIRENVVEPNRGPKYYWYHKKYPRALPIDECYIDDYPCMYEAHLEYERTRKVDRATLDILRFRRDNCWYWNQTKTGEMAMSDACKDISETYDREETNYHMKYGDLHFHASVIHAYNKQKHMMIV